MPSLCQVVSDDASIYPGDLKRAIRKNDAVDQIREMIQAPRVMLYQNPPHPKPGRRRAEVAAAVALVSSSPEAGDECVYECSVVESETLQGCAGWHEREAPRCRETKRFHFVELPPGPTSPKRKCPSLRFATVAPRRFFRPFRMMFINDEGVVVIGASLPSMRMVSR